MVCCLNEKAWKVLSPLGIFHFMAVFLNLRVIYSWSLYEFGIEITSHQEVDCFLRPALELPYNSILHAETALRRRKLKDLLALQLLQLIPETWPWTNDGVDCRFNESCLFKFQPSYCCVIISCARWWDDTRETIPRERDHQLSGFTLD